MECFPLNTWSIKYFKNINFDCFRCLYLSCVYIYTSIIKMRTTKTNNRFKYVVINERMFVMNNRFKICSFQIMTGNGRTVQIVLRTCRLKRSLYMLLIKLRSSSEIRVVSKQLCHRVKFEDSSPVCKRFTKEVYFYKHFTPILSIYIKR